MSNSSDFIIQDHMMINYELRNGVLTKYAGTDRNVVIPENVTAIGQRAFAECKKVQSVTIPSSVNFIADGAFEKCTALKSVMIHDGALIIRDNAFKGCGKLTAIKGIGVTEIGDIFGLSKKNEVVIPLIFPNVSLSKVKNALYKISLTMGYVMEPSLYKGKGLAGYKKYLEENRDLILETAQRHSIDLVIAVLAPSGKAQVAEETVGIEQMSVAAARELFEIQNKTSGVKILWYKGNEQIVDIPRIIGKTAVTLVAPDAFSNDKIVRCSAKTFEKLGPSIQFNTYLKYLSGEITFSAEQQKAMISYFEKKRYLLLEFAVALRRVEILSLLLEKPLKLEEYEALVEKADTVGDTQITATIIAAKNRVFTPEQANAIHAEGVEKELGFREKTLEDYRKIFSLYKNKIENPGDAAYSIVNLKQKLAIVEVPAHIEGGLVDLFWKAFEKNKTMETLVICEGITTIGYGVARGCRLLKHVRIPASVMQIGDNSFVECAPELTIYAPAGSFAEIWAKEKNIPFVAE